MTGTGQSQSPLSALIRTVLTHPVAMALKRRLRDARWQRTGALVVNPPLPDHVQQIVFVCLGNICRSPFAAALTAARLREGRADVRVISAGLNTTQSNRPPDAAVEAARRYGCSLDGHRTTSVTEKMIAACDMVVAMEVRHIDELAARWPEWRQRYFLLPLFEPPSNELGAFERCNLVDPFGKDAAEFRRCYERIDRAVTGMLRTLR
jgi:protein-tyrosine phosphatase